MSELEKSGAIVIHAYGFESENKICQIAKLRLTEAAIKAMAAGINNVIFSGGVRYKEGSTFLAHLMGKFLRKTPWYKYGNLNIDYAIDCFDSSIDIQNFIKIAKEKQFDYLYAISSYWHLWALEPLYKYWSKKLNYKGQVYTFCDNKMIDHYLTGKKLSFFISSTPI